MDFLGEDVERIDRLEFVGLDLLHDSGGLVGNGTLGRVGVVLDDDDAVLGTAHPPQDVGDDGDVLLAISQSGETADTIAAIREAKAHGALALGVCNVVGSTLSRETDAGVFTHAGPEIGVASTKAFTSQLMLGAMMALYVARLRDMSFSDGVRFVNALKSAPDLVRKVLQRAKNDGWWQTYQVVSNLVDQPIAGLLQDLKRRGLLDSTLVIWGGEFGRSPEAQGGKGRDHHNLGFTVWLAGGGVRGGQVIGATDEIGLRAVERPYHFRDLHATLLHLLGVDQEALTYQHLGREERLTELLGNVIEIGRAHV